MGIKINFDAKAIESKIKAAAIEKAKTMSFDISCPHCGAKLNAKAGNLACPACGNRIDLKVK